MLDKKHYIIFAVIIGVFTIIAYVFSWHNDIVEAEAEELWLQIVIKNQISEYQKYIENDGKYKKQARNNIVAIQEDTLAFENATKAQTQEALQQYIKSCIVPNCAYLDIADKTINSIIAIATDFNQHLKANQISKGKTGFALNDVERLQLIVPKDDKIKKWHKKILDKYLKLAQQAQSNKKYALAQRYLTKISELNQDNHIKNDQLAILKEKVAKAANRQKMQLITAKTQEAMQDMDKLLADFKACNDDCPDYIENASDKINKYEQIKISFNNLLKKQYLSKAYLEIDQLKKLAPKAKQIELWLTSLAKNFYLLAKESENNKSLQYINKGLKLFPNDKPLLDLKSQIKTTLKSIKVYNTAKQAGTFSKLNNYLANCSSDCPGFKEAQQKVTKAENLHNEYKQHIAKNQLIYGKDGYALQTIEKYRLLFPKDAKLKSWQNQLFTKLIKGIKNNIKHQQYTVAKKRIKLALKVYPKNRQLKRLNTQIANKSKKGMKAKRQKIIPALVFVQGGDFTMGSNFEYAMPKRKVKLKDFKISSTEITFNMLKNYAREKRIKLNSGNWGANNRPAINISWHQANDYTKWLTKKTKRKFRLPTEAEWEYVARQSKAVLSDTRMNLKTICKFANGADLSTSFPWRNRKCNDGFNEKTAPVKHFLPNNLGIYGMHGNVWEWTADCWHDNFKGAPSNNLAWDYGGDCGRRVTKGGGWNSSVYAMLPGFRASAIAKLEYNYIGFRVVEEL